TDTLFVAIQPSAPFRNGILRVLGLTDKEQIRLRLDDHTQPFAKHRWSSTNNIRTDFGGGTSHFQSAQAIYLSLERRQTTLPHTEPSSRWHLVTSWTAKRLSLGSSSRSLNSLCLLRRALTLSKLVWFVIGSPAHFRKRFRSLSNVNRSGSQNANRNAAAAAE